jgi:hypothetical protein
MLLIFVVAILYLTYEVASLSGKSIALGASPGGAGAYGNPPWNNVPIDSYVQTAGHEPDFVLWFQSWGPYSDGVFPEDEANDLHRRGYSQVITWVPQDYTTSGDDPGYSLDAILSGRHDAYIQRYARALAAWEHPVYLRPFHEMNGDTYPYSASKNANTPEKLISAWRKVHQMFIEEGATNVEWVWSPNVGTPSYTPRHPMASYYPGDDYVDWLALDGYNWAEARNLPWYSFDEIYSQSYAEITAINSKPLMIAEIASHTEPGDKAAWISGMHEAVPTKYPRVKAVSWFHQNTEGALFRMDTSASSRRAYRAMAADARWQGHLP